MKRIMMVFSIALAFQASAANYSLNKNVDNKTEAFGAQNVEEYWTDMETGSPATDVVTDSDDCYVLGGHILTTSTNTPSFPGNALHIGSADASSSGKLNVRGDFSCNVLRWHAGEIYLQAPS